MKFLTVMKSIMIIKDLKLKKQRKRSFKHLKTPPLILLTMMVKFCLSLGHVERSVEELSFSDDSEIDSEIPKAKNSAPKKQDENEVVTFILRSLLRKNLTIL